MTINYDILPEHIRAGVKRYIEQRIKPGAFLQAVISNNLIQSLVSADDINIRKITDILNFFYSEAPYECHGSAAKMIKWLGGHKE